MTSLEVAVTWHPLLAEDALLEKRPEQARIAFLVRHELERRRLLQCSVELTAMSARQSICQRDGGTSNNASGGTSGGAHACVSKFVFCEATRVCACRV
eukprot:m.64220 g.64220  ORF g.64220 m.64220 type:complete len:98 (+) comp7242_c0_seq1:656-949(+)